MNFNIGISGLRTAQWAIDLIGTNIANAAAQGYHRQDAKIAALDQRGAGGGSGSVAQTSLRRVDVLLEQERVRQQPLQGQVAQELEVLQVVESLLGDLETEGLAKAVGTFFNSLTELSSNPTSQPYQQAVVSAATGMTNQFNNVANLLTDLGRNVVLKADDVLREINTIAGEIANLNSQIMTSETQGYSPNDLYDRRDQAVYELGLLVDVHVQPVKGTGTINVVCNELPLVTGVTTHPLQSGVVDEGLLAISREDSEYYVTDVTGGRLGGLVALKNQILPQIRSDLDTLAAAIATQVNRVHVQGVGTAGSFSQLTGLPVESTTLSTWAAGVSDGEVRVRVTGPGGQVQVHRLAVDADTDTLATMAAKFNALDPAHLSASVVDASLRLQTVPGYTFDFLPTVETVAAGLSGSSALTVQGAYAGAENQSYTVRLLGSGVVGSSAALQAEVLDAGNNRLALLNVGAGYPPGTLLDGPEGLKLSFGAGTVVGGEQAAIHAAADSDTSGFLAAAGLNTLFSGSTAQSLRVTSLVQDSVRRVAHARSGGMFDNVNALRMAEVGRTALASLRGNTIEDQVLQMANGVAQSIASRQSRLEGLQSVINQLDQQRDAVSGVDINDQATQLLMFERMFQAMSRFINIQDQALQSLMEIL